MSSNLKKKQECIPVGCVPPAAVAICWGVCLSACWDTPPSVDLEPPGYGPRDSPGCGPGDPPARPLNFSPGCGPGQTPQALKLPLAVGLVTCKAYWDTTPRVELQTRVKHNLAPPRGGCLPGVSVCLGVYTSPQEQNS